MDTEERKAYVVEAVRDEDEWWIVKVPEVDGAMTQARRLDQVEEMARDVVSLLLEVPPDSFDLVVKPLLSEPLASQVAETRELRELAERSQVKAAAATGPLVEELLAGGFRVREIGQLLGMTYQRAAQLAARTRGPASAATQPRGRPRAGRRQGGTGAASRRVSKRPTPGG
ncbi:MAG: transcriptional regulator [Candidatus Dormibacteraeota bacterium]|nr:transcriptional regulator [Candidatus Dormibacteraeota bacterium]